MADQPVTAVLAYLGMGANEGPREANIQAALAALDRVPGIEVEGMSPLVETAPLPAEGDPGAATDLGGAYLNSVARLRTTLAPAALLAVCKAQERAAGRILPALRMAPRPLDLDILLYGDERVDTADLRVPHPALWQRSFWAAGLSHFEVDVADLLPPPRPEVWREAAAFAAACSGWLEGGCTVGLVPTMGALHDGHGSLIRRARQECDRVVATVFVNPLQFGPGEDFDSYPRTFERDLELLRAERVDGVFGPPTAAMFPEDFCSRIAVGVEADGLEGATRPQHFSGVATVVARLLALARPHRAYFGRKDAQQVAVLRRMVADLGFPCEVVECPIVREPDGLARSSRNVFLTEADRRAAAVLHRALQRGRAAFAAGATAADVVAAATAEVAAEPRATLDYLELRREGDLAPLGELTADGGGRLLVAAWFGPAGQRTRLIDNLSLVPTADEVDEADEVGP